MFKTLLVPLDGTPAAAVALPVARILARACQAQLVLVRVTSDEYPRQRPAAGQYLARVAAELAASGLDVSTEVRRGDPPAEILGAVRDHRADVVVMATHGRQGLRRALAGSVADGVLSHSPVPVLLVRPGGRRTTRLRTLLVPVDGTPAGARALGRAVALARATGARIVLLQVVPLPLWMYTPEFGGATLAAALDPSWDDEARQSAQSYLSTLASWLREDGVQAEAHALIGDVVPTIAAVAGEVGADLIVMSTHARVGAARAALGSRADAVVRAAHRPVLLVRRAAQATRSPAAPAPIELARAG